MVSRGDARGTTLIELMIAATIFLIFMGLLYPSFSFLQERMSSIHDAEVLAERGNRLLDYLSEKIGMTGFLIGSNPVITFCGIPAVNSLSHTEGDPYDAITILTAVPIETDAVNMPYLRITSPAQRNDTAVAVNTTNVSSAYIDPNGTRNAKALVTFDEVKPTYPYGVNQWSGTVYTAAVLAGGRLVFADDPVTADAAEDRLTQDINSQSVVYAVRMTRFATNAARELQEVGWNRNCGTGGETLALDETFGPRGAWGGVDALQFEYVLASDPGTFHPTISVAELPDLRSVRISLLLRAGFPDRNYINNESYRVGNLLPRTYRDSYKRMLVTRTVDVRNMGLWRS